MQRFKRFARKVLEYHSARKPEHEGALVLMHLQRPFPRGSFIQPQERHLRAAISWIKTAQDSTATGGVPWGYRMRRPIRTKLPLGWIGPYPETTGYIISTMLRFAERYNDPDSTYRAKRMVEWELQIQLPDGGLQGGIYGDAPVASSTFVTGQVLFGLVDTYLRYGRNDVRQAALRAGDWLLTCLDDTGRFIRGYSHFAAPGPKAYEARTGLALAQLSEATGRTDFLKAARRMADFSLSCQQPNGWFDQNDLETNEKPLTHTIGYVLEGLHGIGARFDRPDCLQAVDRVLDTIAALIDSNGYLAGRWYRNWVPAADWVCLTGSAQIAGVFLRRYRETSNATYLDAGQRLLGFVCFTQDLKPGCDGVDGGICGSYPVDGEYCRWTTINWAAKFFCDSMMDYLAIRRKGAQNDILL